MTFDTHLPLDERILRIDHIQARRYSKLNGVALEIATEGIVRHLKACDRMDVNPDTSAVREIIDDALNGRRVFAETNRTHSRGLSQVSRFISKEIALAWAISFLFAFCAVVARLTSVFDMLTSPTPLKCAPVAQRIEHLPCWSLNGESVIENSLSGRPHMRERPESLWYSI